MGADIAIDRDHGPVELRRRVGELLREVVLLPLLVVAATAFGQGGRIDDRGDITGDGVGGNWNLAKP